MRYYTNVQIKKRIKFRNNIKIAFKVITYPIIALIFLVLFYALGQKLMGEEKQSDLLGIKAYIVTSGSMEKYINIGDLIVEKKPSKEEDIKQGDIISFEVNGAVVTHRIVEIKEEEGQKIYITKGDNNNSIDGDGIKYENIIGEYLVKIPKVGFIVAKFQNFGLVIATALVLFFIYGIALKKEERTITRHEKRMKLENSTKN